jgi:hypothetical protein
MSSFEIRWAGPDRTDPESLDINAVFEAAMSPEAKDRFRASLAGWADRATINGFGDWEGYAHPVFSGDGVEMRSVAAWGFDASHGDYERAMGTMCAWLELFVKESGVAITHLVVGHWEPQEPIPELAWGY